MKFTNIFTGWPGCDHDARVLRNSVLYTEAEVGNLVLHDHYILADSAYPLRNWLKLDSTRDYQVQDKLSNERLVI